MKYVLAILSLAVSFTALTAHAETRDEAKERLMIEEPYEAPAGQLFDEDAYLAGQTDLNQFVNVIVINKKAKGPGAQSLRLYTNRQLILTTKVSTGAESLEYVTGWSGFWRQFGKGAQESHWRHTTRGFYPIARVEGEDYQSSENKFHMPYAMFFNEKKGLAVHQVPPDLGGGEEAGNNELGHRASSGCVRVHKDYILTIHDAVEAAGRGEIPQIDSRTGLQKDDADGQPLFKTAYRSIVIVEEK